MLRLHSRQLPFIAQRKIEKIEKIVVKAINILIKNNLINDALTIKETYPFKTQNDLLSIITKRIIFDRKTSHSTYFSVKISNILPYGGPDGELGASLRYLSQRFAMPLPELKGTLTDIGTEELNHLEMIGAIVYQLTKDLPRMKSRNRDSVTILLTTQPEFSHRRQQVFPIQLHQCRLKAIR